MRSCKKKKPTTTFLVMSERNKLGFFPCMWLTPKVPQALPGVAPEHILCSQNNNNTNKKKTLTNADT